MRLMITLALRDLFRERVHLICNMAVLAGVLVPLLVMFGVKNGVYDALIGRLMSNPSILQIDTSGNGVFSDADAADIRGWPETGFVTLKTRSIFDFVNVRSPDGGGKRDALLVPSGTGDPMLPDGVALGPGQAAISRSLAEQLGLAPGGTLQVITQATERPRQLVVPLEIVAVLPAERMGGRAVLADIAVLDLVEAFYDGYALPDYGIETNRPLSSRAASFEGLRVFARDLQSLKPLQDRIEARFGISTEAHTREVEIVLGLGRNLNLALLVTVAVSAIGLAAALIFGFWGEVARKRQMIAVLALLGLGGRLVWLFPIVQALTSAAFGLCLSFGLFFLAGLGAERLFDTGLVQSGRLVSISFGQGASIAAAVFIFVGLAALFAARSAQKIDPATVLREGPT